MLIFDLLEKIVMLENIRPNNLRERHDSQVNKSNAAAANSRDYMIESCDAFAPEFVSELEQTRFAAFLAEERHQSVHFVRPFGDRGEKHRQQLFIGLEHTIQLQTVGCKQRASKLR